MGRCKEWGDFTGWDVAQNEAISQDGTMHRTGRFHRTGRCTEWGDFTGWDVAQDGAILQDGTLHWMGRYATAEPRKCSSHIVSSKSANDRMWPFHATAEPRKCSSHIVSSKFLSVAISTIHSMWLVKNLYLKTATFQFFFSQSHLIQVIRLLIQMKNVCEETLSIIDDISRCKCRIVS